MESVILDSRRDAESGSHQNEVIWKPVKVVVTPVDIESGLRCHYGFCPIHKAIERHTSLDFLVDYDRVIFEEFNRREVELLPTWITDIIQRYDKGLRMIPFYFDFRVPRLT